MVLTALPLASPPLAAAVSTSLVINEVDYDQASTDTAEFLELKNVGAGAVDLSAFSVELVNGTGGGAAVYQTIALPAVSLGAGDFYVVCADAATTANCDLDVSPDSNLIQNGGPDAVALREGATLIDSVSYEGVTGSPYTEGASGSVGDTGDGSISRCPDGTDTDANDADFALTPLTPGAANDCPGGGGSDADLVINEIDYDQDSTDAAEFLELKNVGSEAADLSAFSVELVNGSNGTIYATIGLPAVSLAAGAYFVVCGDAANVANCDHDVSPNTNLIQNGAPDAVALRQGTTLIDTVSYEGDTVAPYTEGSGAGLSDFDEDGESISRCPDGVDTDQNNADFSLRPASPGTVNACPGTDGAPSVTSTTPADGATNVANGSNITIDFSEAVTVSGSSFQISCSTTGAHTATVSGGPTSFTLDPDADFVDLETCTVTVFAAQVSDQDANDPPDNMAADYTFSFLTEGDVCTLPYTPIYDIQGSGTNAALTGTRSTQGVVVGDFEGPSTAGLQGFYIQDPAGDGDATTADGIFVFAGSTDNGLSVGDVVRVTGSVSEFNSQTQISGSSVTGCGTAPLPAHVEVSLPAASSTAFERYEGMLVRFPQDLVISEYFQYEQFGELVLARPLPGEDRPFTPTAVEEPGAAANARAAANVLSRITLNDGLASSNPPTVRHPNGAPFSLSNTFRGGDLVTNAVGVLGQRFGYRIEPTGPADYTSVNPRSASPANVGGRLKVAAMNMLNYFLTPDNIQEFSNEPNDPADDICGPAPWPNHECRGWDFNQPTELQRQRDKLIAALAGLDADVVGLNEIENTTGVEPMADIVAGLNDVFGPGTYAYIDTGTIGTDAIKVGFIYRPGSVTPVGAYKILDSSVDPRFNDTKSRPVLAQTFRENATGAVFTVAVNHLKSKGSSCNDVGDPDAGDGQGNCNVTRTLAAQALVDWLATDPTGSSDPDFMIIGDLNSYAMEDPIDAVRAGADDLSGTGDDYTNLVALYGGRYAYSYVFDGQFGYLDHALANSSLTAQITGATEWHINADEPDILDYDTTFKPLAQEALYEPNAFRSSDHDPVLVGLNLTTAKGMVTGDGKWAEGSFEVSVRFLPRRTVPSGSTTLTVPTGTFVASSFDWLVLSGDRATFQGQGSFNGTPGYGFLFSVDDNGSPGKKDRIRVRIWEPDGDTVYDSQPGAAVSAAPTTQPTGGNLVVH